MTKPTLHTPDPTTSARRVRIWDLPTRVFHWLLAAAVIGLIVTGKTGNMLWHTRLGLLVLALVVFRLVWGLVGGRWSRFASFIYAPGTVLRYLRGPAATPGAQAEHERLEAGHSPLGALSVLAMLAILIAQVATGLVADDEIATTGPLYRFVASATVAAATAWHKGYGQWLLIALVVMHVLAILFYVFVKKKTLIQPMLTGDKALPSEAVESARDNLASRALALAVGAAAAALAYWVGTLGA